jgi:hypothetical protein
MGKRDMNRGMMGNIQTQREKKPPLSIPLPTRATRVGRGIIMDSIKAPPSILI